MVSCPHGESQAEAGARSGRGGEAPRLGDLEDTMTTEQKIIRAKVGLLELAKQLGNVSQACKMMGYSRDSFYRFKELYETGGELALQEISRKKPVLKNRVPQEIEDAIVALAIEQPAFRPGSHRQRAPEAMDDGLPRRRALRVAAPRPRDHEEAAQGAGGQECPGGAGAHRGAGCGAGAREGREGGPRRVRERASGLLWCPGYVLRGQPEGRGTHLPADLCRHLHQSRLRQALRSQDADHRGRSPQ